MNAIIYTQYLNIYLNTRELVSKSQIFLLVHARQSQSSLVFAQEKEKSSLQKASERRDF